MSYRLSVDIIGADELARALRQAGSVTVRELSRAIATTAYALEGSAKRKAPINEGTLRASIHTEGPNVTSNNIGAKVGTNLNYARYQEEGTGLYGPRHQMITPVNAKMLAWKSGGQWHFARSTRGSKPHWYMRDARDEIRPQFRVTMDQALQRIVDALATS